jgi:hypothetical protein
MPAVHPPGGQAGFPENPHLFVFFQPQKRIIVMMNVITHAEKY